MRHPGEMSSPGLSLHRIRRAHWLALRSQARRLPALLLTAIIAFALIGLAWVAYPLVMRWRGTALLAAGVDPREPVERVCVVVATRDDPRFAVERVRNLHGGDYPPHLLRVVLAVDANSPHVIEAYRQALGGLAEVVAGEAPGGKAVTLNAGVRAAGDCDVLVFADVGQEFGVPAIRRLVNALATRHLDGVTGRYVQQANDATMVAYADFEALIRAGQSAGRSVVSASGAILAMRPSFWRDLPAGLICDDLFTGLSIVRQGGRLGFEPQAIAFDPRTFTRDQQFVRRARTLTGLVQYCTLEPGVLLPWRNPVWIHFMLHKVLRLLTPVLLAVGGAALGTWLVMHWPTITTAAVLSILVVVLAAGLVAPRPFARLGEQVTWLVRLAFLPAVALANGLRGRWSVWAPTPQQRGPAGSA